MITLGMKSEAATRVSAEESMARWEPERALRMPQEDVVSHCAQVPSSTLGSGADLACSFPEDRAHEKSKSCRFELP